jgi:hypothetical protein
MPDRPQSTSPPDPLSWEVREGFRETLLLHLTRPGDADALRAFGALLYAAALECASSWPSWPESSTRMELRAVALDLQHASGASLCARTTCSSWAGRTPLDGSARGA